MSKSKIFGRASAAIPHLTTGKGGVAGEVDDLRNDVESGFKKLESDGGLLRTVEFTNPPVADVDAYKTSIATALTQQVYTGAALNGAIGVAELTPPRNPTVTSTLHAHVLAVSVVFHGKIRDENNVLVDQNAPVLLTAGGGATDVATKCLSVLESITVPANGGVGGALEFGFGALIGLPIPMKSRAGLLKPIREIAVGVVVTTGTFTTAAAQPPHGTYAPAAAPDGTRDYALTYEVEV
jgi:hypothetical protein